MELPGSWVQLAIRHLDGTNLCGDVGIQAVDAQPATFQIGFTLAPPWQGRGYATEAVLHLSYYLFRVRQAHRLIATCDLRNGPAARVLLRVGMRQSQGSSRLITSKGSGGLWTPSVLSS
jgi:RimJ/RimL family protein N-acetyltransferase